MAHPDGSPDEARISPAPPAAADRKSRRAGYLALAASGLLTATTFAGIADLAGSSFPSADESRGGIHEFERDYSDGATPGSELLPGNASPAQRRPTVSISGVSSADTLSPTTPTRVVMTRSDGTTTTVVRNPDGTTTTTVRSPSGTTTTTTTAPDGTTTTSPGGSTTTSPGGTTTTSPGESTTTPPPPSSSTPGSTTPGTSTPGTTTPTNGDGDGTPGDGDDGPGDGDDGGSPDGEQNAQAGGDANTNP